MSKSPRTLTRPQPGYYLLRRIRRGWAVPCRIVESDGQFQCYLDGELMPGSWAEEEIAGFWIQFLIADSVHPIVQIQCHGITCDEATYAHRMAMKVWAAQSAPDHPCLHTMRPIDLGSLAADEF